MRTTTTPATLSNEENIKMREADFVEWKKKGIQG